VHRFVTTLVPGRKAPYTTWAFVELPAGMAESWGRGPFDVRGAISGVKFRGRVSRGEGVYRMSVSGPLRKEAGVQLGDSVKVAIELDPEPREVVVPPELRAVLAESAKLAAEHRPRDAFAAPVRGGPEPPTASSWGY